MDKFIEILRNIRDVIWPDIQEKYSEINQFSIDSQNIMSNASTSALSAANAANSAQSSKEASDQNVITSSDNASAAEGYANQSKGYRDEAEQFAQETQDIANLIGQGSFLKGNNLSDVLNVEEVRNNLGVDSSAEVDLKLSAPDVNVIASTTIQVGHHKSYAGRIITSGRVVVRGILTSVSSKPKEVQDDFSVQAGEYRDFAMMNPKGRWLFCDGREVSRSEFADLFEAIGTVYGKGDGSTTFNIPNLQGVFKRTLDVSRNLDPDKNRKVGGFQNYDWKSFFMSDTIQSGTGYAHVDVNMGKDTSNYVGNLFTGFWEAPGCGIGLKWNNEEIRPVNISVYTCIRY